MWPTLKDGQIIDAIERSDARLGDIVVAKHPLKNATVIKRITRVDGDEMFIEGDNPDPLGSEDSHNFGTVPMSSIIAIIRD